MRRFFFLILVLTLALVSCADKGSAPDAVEKYLKAKAAADADKMINLSCKEWEAQAQLDAASFQSVDAKTQDLSCRSNGKDGKYTLVSCEGKIVVAYRGENREFNLSEATYRAIQEDDEWKMCGEQANS